PRPRGPPWRPGGVAGCSPQAETPALALDAQRRLGQRLQALLGDGGAAVLADAVGDVVDAGDGGLDLLYCSAGLGRDGQFAIALDGQGVALARLPVELNVAGLAVLGERVGLSLQGLALAQLVLPLGLEQRQLADEEGV